LGGPSREPIVPCTRFGSARVGPSGVKFLEEPVVGPDSSDPDDDGEGLEPGLDDEPEFLLDFLNDRRRRVAKSLYRTLPGLPCRIELGLLDFLAFQLDRELISHNVIVSTLEEKVCKLLLKIAGTLEEMEELRKDKAALEVKLLRRLEELKKVFDDISRLQERVALDRWEIASVRARSIGNTPREWSSSTKSGG